MYTSYDPPRFVRLLSLLKEHGSEYLSGQDLSDVLKISRIAVWKHIERLRTLGYAIESQDIRIQTVAADGYSISMGDNRWHSNKNAW